MIKFFNNLNLLYQQLGLIPLWLTIYYDCTSENAALQWVCTPSKVTPDLSPKFPGIGI